MTEQEFQAWMAEEDVRAEWVDGEVIAFMPPTLRHQQLIMFLGTLLHIFAISKQLGSVVVAPYAMRLRSGRSYREPDIVFVSTHNHARLDQARLEGPADIAIEIVSDDSVARDRLQKFSEYAASGIREYWIIDPRDGQCDARVFALVDGSYSQIEPDEFGRWHSHVLSGLWIDPAWLFAEELPNPISVLAEIDPGIIRVSAAFDL
jgi:Uma2 family endonuclease